MSRPTISHNQIQDRRSGCGGICHQVLGLLALQPIQPCNFMNNRPLGMNLIPLDNWHWAEKPLCVGFRIDCVTVVEGCSCETGVRMLSIVIKRVCRVASTLKLSSEKPPGTRECYGYPSLSDWSELAFSLIQRWCSENRTLSASVTLPQGL